MGTNLRRMTPADHDAYGQRLRHIQQMLDPLVEEVCRDYGVSSRVGKVAARFLSNLQGSDLSKLRHQLGETWHAEGHYHKGHRNPYEDR